MHWCLQVQFSLPKYLPEDALRWKMCSRCPPLVRFFHYNVIILMRLCLFNVQLHQIWIKLYKMEQKLIRHKQLDFSCLYPTHIFDVQFTFHQDIMMGITAKKFNLSYLSTEVYARCANATMVLSSWCLSIICEVFCYIQFSIKK